jgi:hypothetical protein
LGGRGRPTDRAGADTGQGTAPGSGPPDFHIPPPDIHNPTDGRRWSCSRATETEVRRVVTPTGRGVPKVGGPASQNLGKICQYMYSMPSDKSAAGVVEAIRGRRGPKSGSESRQMGLRGQFGAKIAHLRPFRGVRRLAGAVPCPKSAPQGSRIRKLWSFSLISGGASPYSGEERALVGRLHRIPSPST